MIENAFINSGLHSTQCTNITANIYILIKTVTRTWKIIYYDLVDIDFPLHDVVLQSIRTFINAMNQFEMTPEEKEHVDIKERISYFRIIIIILKAMPHFSGISSSSRLPL